MKARSTQQGFTLVELVMVIVLLGIISVGSVGFISSSVQGYADMSRRDRLSSVVRTSVEQISRELRNALPNSVRVVGNCLEFVPIERAARYLSIPMATADTTVELQPGSLTSDMAGYRVAAYPSITTNIYTLTTASTLSSIIDNGTDTLTLTANHTFPAASPQRRLYVVSQPISYCLDGTHLYRYQNYGFTSAQPTTATLPTIDSKRWLVASGVESPSGQLFLYLDAALQRNALVQVDLQASDSASGEQVRLQHEIRVRNVP